MSAFIDGTDKLSRTTNLVAASSDYSCAFWFRNKSTPGGGDYKVAFTFINAGYTAFTRISSQVGTDIYEVTVDNGAGGTGTTATVTVLQDQWYAFAYTRSGTTHSFHADGVTLGSTTVDVSAVTWTEQLIGYDGTAVNDFDVFGFKEWDSALTIGQLIVEWNDAAATVTAYTNTPLDSDVLDDSGNSHDWTNSGPVTFPATSPVQVPLTNNASGTPYIINALPISGVQITRAAGTTNTTWFTYTEGGASDRVLDFHFYGRIPPAGGYSVTTGTYLTAPDLPHGLNTTARNAGQQLPIPTGGVMYFQAIRNSSAASPAVLAFDIFYAPNQTPITAGWIYIRSASITSAMITAGLTGLPGGFVDVSTDSIVSFIPQFITGESGDILPTGGHMLFADEFASLIPFSGSSYGVALYNEDFSLLTSFYFNAGGSGAPLIRTHNESNKFYILSKGIGLTASTYRSVDEDGNLGTLKTMTGSVGAGGFAVNVDETILYIGGVGGSANSNVKRWDMVNEVYLSDLAGVVASHRVTDILVLSDDSVIVCYFKSTVVRTCVVIRYSSAGAVLNTYTMTFSTTITAIAPRLGYASDSPTSFWFLGHLTTGTSDIRQIQVSDGTILNQSLIFDTATGAEADVLVPDLPFISDSCPIIEMRESVTPPIPPPAGYTVIEHPIRRLRRAPHLNNEHKRIFYPGFELEVQRGVGILADPGREPQIMLRVSRDGGQTWGSYMNMSAGALGAYKARPRVQRLGTSRDMVFEITTTDPNDFEIINAWLTPDPQPGEN